MTVAATRRASRRVAACASASLRGAGRRLPCRCGLDVARRRLAPSQLSDARLQAAAITLADGLAFGARGEGQRHAVLEHRLGQRRARRRPTARSGRRAARGRAPPASAPGWRAGRGPRRSACRSRRASGPGRAERTSVEDRLDHRLADRQAAHQALRRHQVFGASSPASARVSSAPVVSNRMRRSASRSG